MQIKTLTTGPNAGTTYYVDNNGKFAGLATHSNPNVDVKTYNESKGYTTPEVPAAPSNLSDIEKLKLDSGLTNIYDTQGNPVVPAAPSVTPPNSPEGLPPTTVAEPTQPQGQTMNLAPTTFSTPTPLPTPPEPVDDTPSATEPQPADPAPADTVGGVTATNTNIDGTTKSTPDPVASDAGVAPAPPPNQIPNPTNDSGIAALNATLANPTGINPNTGQQYSFEDIFIAKEQYKAQTGLNFDTGQPDAPIGPTTNIDGETYTGIDTSDLSQYQGTGGTDTVVINNTTYENFDKDKFRNDNATNVVPTQVTTGTTGTPAGTTETTGTPSPTSAITPTPVTQISDAQVAAGNIATGAGQITGKPTEATASTADSAATAADAGAVTASTYTAQKAQPDAQTALNKVEAETIDTTGGLPTDATVTGQTLAPQPPPVTTQPATAGTTTTTAQTTAQPTATDVGQLVEQKAGADSGLRQIGLDAAQIGTAQTVDAPTSLAAVQTTADVQGDLLNTNVSSVDQGVVENAISKTAAATATPSEKATVQGQLATLTSNFDATNPPAWAAGALRAANAQMSARGLSASSMAGQAILQATMESAIPIAQIDASTFAQFEVQNLSNRQQVAMFGAQQRAKFLELEFNQDFQMRVANASRVADIANINFSADQQIALENSRMAQSVDLANLTNRQAKVMADAAALTNLDMTELNNRQQAAVMNAQNFLAIEMANLNNEQQTSLFKAQAIQQAILSDKAAENAQLQFNASSKNQVAMFMANLSADINKFNADQKNAIERFNAGEENALEQFNKELEERRAQFNASQSLVIAQANAAWRQATTTGNTAEINEANRIDARASTEMTRAQMDEYWQTERDKVMYIWKSAEQEKDRLAEILMTELAANKEIEAQNNAARASFWASVWSTLNPFS